VLTRGGLRAELEYGYTPEGARAFVQWVRSDSGGGVCAGRTDYLYGPGGLLAEIRSGGQPVVRYTYDKAGRLVEKQLAGGVRIRYGHDPLGRIGSMEVRSGKGRRLTALEYDWDKAGQLAARRWDGIEQRYAYDPAGQLIAVKTAQVSTKAGDGLNNLLPDESYAYDLAGNMTRKTVGGITTTMEYDPANRLVRSVQKGGSVGVTTTYAYDPAGRLQREMVAPASEDGQPVHPQTTAYEYGLFEKVASVTRPDGSRVRFDYWATGQLAGKSSDAVMPASASLGLSEDSSSGNESYLWDGLALLEQGDSSFILEPHPCGGVAVASTRADGGQLATGSKRPSSSNPPESGQSRPTVYGLQSSASGFSTLLVSDFLGTTLGVVEGETFTPTPLTAFGEEIATRPQSETTNAPEAHKPCETREKERPGSGLPAGNFLPRFTGKHFDPDLHAYSFLFRNYRPDLARWSAPDPSGFPDGPNQWAYCNNGATSRIDPLGLDTERIMTDTGSWMKTEEVTKRYCATKVMISSINGVTTSRTVSGGLSFTPKTIEAQVREELGLTYSDQVSYQATYDWIEVPGTNKMTIKGTPADLYSPYVPSGWRFVGWIKTPVDVETGITPKSAWANIDHTERCDVIVTSYKWVATYKIAEIAE